MRKNKKLLVVLAIIAILITGFTMTVEAMTSQSTVSQTIGQDSSQSTMKNFTSELIVKEDLPMLVRCSEIDTNTKHVYHKYNGVEYPAYCLDENAEGASQNNSYSVEVNNEITDVDISGKNVTAIGLWRIIVNGYPYKSIEDLSCKSEQEAYSATQNAIYCYLNSTPLSLYTKVRGENEESSMRVLEALKNIVTNADNSNEMPDKSNKVFYGKAPKEGLQNYALTGIIEKEEQMQTEITKLPVTGM